MKSKLLERRRALGTLAATIAAPAIAACGGCSDAFAQSVPPGVSQAMADYAAMEPLTSAALVRVDAPAGTWTSSHNPDAKLFVGSAIKTFILAQILLDVEAGRNGLTQNTACDINDDFRSLSSSVLGGLTGTSNYRNALEAMIAHSDNMGTDIALAKAEPDRVRALIAQAGLTQTQIPDSTRRLFSYLAGAPIGVDLGWAGMLNIVNGVNTGLTPRSDAINANETMASSATDMVSWYQQALTGKFFQTPTALREFKRISAMADALWITVPADTISYGKGGSIDWAGFHALCVAGQMRTRDVPVSFCFTLNWTGTADSNARGGEFAGAIAKVLAQVDAAIRSA
jgi:beta-lactamase class A